MHIALRSVSTLVRARTTPSALDFSVLTAAEDAFAA